MQFTAQIDVNALGNAIEETFNRVRIPVQAAMAETCFDVTINNFGMSGEDRPVEWESLDDKYAKRVGRSFATLDLKEFKKEGSDKKLIDSVDWNADNPDFALVYLNDPPVYAAAHQWGESGMPERPFLPIVKGSETLTPYTEGKCLDAANKALQEALG